MSITWEQETGFETEDTSEFDSAGHAWDGEASFADGTADEFDSETDADNDLNVAEAAAYDDSYGIEITFDNDTVAYGVLNADAVDQTAGVIHFAFNLNDVAIESSSKSINILYVVDGASAPNWLIQVFNVSGTHMIRAYATDDDAGAQTTTLTTLSSGWHEITLIFGAASGVGEDDGYMYLFLDGVETAGSLTDIDNDTKDWDAAWFGMCYTSSTSFDGSLYMDRLKIDTNGAVFASKLAALEGVYGGAFYTIGSLTSYVDFTDPSNEEVVTVEFKLDPNTITMGDGDLITLVKLIGDSAGGTTDTGYVYLRYSSGAYQVCAGIVDNTVSATHNTSYVTITDAEHTIRFVLVIGTITKAGGTTSTGYGILYVDEVPYVVSGVTNFLRDVDTIRFLCDPASGDEATTYGIVYLDDCRWADEYDPLGLVLDYKEKDYTVTFEDKGEIAGGGWNLEGIRYQGEGSNVSPKWTALFLGKSNVAINDVYVYKEGSTTDIEDTVMSSGSVTVSGNRATLKPLSGLTGGEVYIINIDATCDGARDYYYFKVGALKQETGLLTSNFNEDLIEQGIWNLEKIRYQGEGSSVTNRWALVFQGKYSTSVNNVYVYKEGSTTDGASTYMPGGSHLTAKNIITLKPLTALVGGEYFIICVDATIDGQRDHSFFKVGALKQETGLV